MRRILLLLTVALVMAAMMVAMAMPAFAEQPPNRPPCPQGQRPLILYVPETYYTCVPVGTPSQPPQ